MIRLATLILGTMLVVQAAQAAATPQASMGYGDIKELIGSAGTTYMEFFGYATEKYRELFEKVLTNSNNDAESDPELKSALMPFAQFVSKMHTMSDRSREALQILFDECTQLADKYDRGVPVDASKADHKIAKYMNEANAMKTKFDILMKYITSLQLFANNVRKYLNTLPEPELENQRKLKMWYTNWQREHDWEKKNDLMLRFFEIFDDTKDDRSRLNEKVIRNILLYLNSVVMAHKDLFKRSLRAIETEIKNPDDSVKHTMDMMKDFVDRAEKVHDLKGREITMELLKLFSTVQDRRRWYKSDQLPEGEQKIAKIMEKNGEVDVEVREMLLTFGLGEELTKDVEEYFDIIPRERMADEERLRGWFEDVSDEREYEVRAGKLVSLIEFLR